MPNTKEPHFTKKGPGRKHNGSTRNPPGSKLARKIERKQVTLKHGKRLG